MECNMDQGLKISQRTLVFSTLHSCDCIWVFSGQLLLWIRIKMACGESGNRRYFDISLPSITFCFLNVIDHDESGALSTGIHSYRVRK